MTTQPQTAQVEVEDISSWMYPTPDGDLCAPNYSPEWDYKRGAFTLCLTMENLENPNVPQIPLTVTQVRALVDRLEDLIEPYENLVPCDPRPTPECPSWCNFHREDCEGCHFGKIVVNDIEIEVQWDEKIPGYGDPRVDVSGYDWVNGPDLTDLAEALHIAERLLSAPTEQVSA